jgi:hypothetical protein
LGNYVHFEKQGVSGTSPKPSPPQKQTAAQGVGSQRGGKTEVKAANFRDSDYVRDSLCAIAKSACPHAGVMGGRDPRAVERPSVNLPEVATESRSRSVTVISNLHRESLIAARDAGSAPSAKRFPPATFDPRLLPSRATLARKWPALKINRLSGRWVDDASGAKGDDITSLLAFLGEGAR